MQRWQLTIGLGAAAIAAAALAPTLRAALQPPSPPVATAPAPPVASAPEHIGVGPLQLEAALQPLDPARLHGAPLETTLEVTLSAREHRQVTAESWRGHTALAMDISGSMMSDDKMLHAKRAARAVVDQLHPTDLFSLVTFEDHARLVIPPTRVGRRADLHRTIDSVLEGGGTNLYDALHLAQQQLAQTNAQGIPGRLLVLSDGNANVGVTTLPPIQGLAEHLGRSGVTVHTVGLGDDYDPAVLQAISHASGGQYSHVDDPTHLPSRFTTVLADEGREVAEDIEVSVRLPDHLQLLSVDHAQANTHGDGWTVRVPSLQVGRPIMLRATVKVLATPPAAPQAVAQATYTDLSHPDTPRVRNEARAALQFAAAPPPTPPAVPTPPTAPPPPALPNRAGRAHRMTKEPTGASER